MKSRKTNHSKDHAIHPQSNISPTEWVGLFRQQVLDGIYPMPFTEGVTPEQIERNAAKLRHAVRIAV